MPQVKACGRDTAFSGVRVVYMAVLKIRVVRLFCWAEGHCRRHRCHQDLRYSWYSRLVQ
jgi:hypothetical protein